MIEKGNIVEVSVNSKYIGRMFVSKAENHEIEFKAVEIGSQEIYDIKMIVWTNAKEND